MLANEKNDGYRAGKINCCVWVGSGASSFTIHNIYIYEYIFLNPRPYLALVRLASFESYS
jgi:hypothetical protein